jgi:hypothetical protein
MMNIEDAYAHVKSLLDRGNHIVKEITPYQVTLRGFSSGYQTDLPLLDTQNLQGNAILFGDLQFKCTTNINHTIRTISFTNLYQLNAQDFIGNNSEIYENILLDRFTIASNGSIQTLVNFCGYIVNYDI